jgi:hypothetical protein
MKGLAIRFGVSIDKAGLWHLSDTPLPPDETHRSLRLCGPCFCGWVIECNPLFAKYVLSMHPRKPNQPGSRMPIWPRIFLYASVTALLHFP